MNKIVIFGFSKTGHEISKILKQKDLKFVVIENSPEVVKKAQSYGFDALELSLMDDEHLKKAGITKNVSTLFCVSEDDNLNLFVTLTARYLDKYLKIITLATKKSDVKKLILAGADRAISPYEIGAYRIFRILRKPRVLDMLDSILFSKTDIKIAEITIPENSFLNGMFLDYTNVESKFNIIIIGLQDREVSEKFIFYPSHIKHKIDYKDVLVILGKERDIENFKKEIHK